MWQDLGNLLFITAFFVALPLAVDGVVLWRLSRADADSVPTPTRTVIGYLGLAANFLAIAIVSGVFYSNVWLTKHHSDMVVGSDRSYEVALVLAVFSLILGFMAPKGIRPLLAFAGLYVSFTLILLGASAAVL